MAGEQDLTVRVGAHTLPAVALERVDVEGSNPDEAALKAAGALKRYTQATGFEACANLCKTPTGWRIQPISVHSHSACPIVLQCPEGAEPSGLSLHSHRPAGGYLANRADMVLMGIAHAQGSVVAGDRPELFSEEDFQAPGYMVTPRGEVFFQNGRHQVRRVGWSD